MAGEGALVSFVRGLRATPKKAPSAGFAVAFSDSKKVGKPGVKLYRQWSRESTWVRAAIDIRKGQVSAADWDIVPYDPDRPFSKRLQQRLREMFDTPNPRDESFQTMIEMAVEDILVVDAGSIEKVRNLRGEIMEMWPVDGGEIKVSKVWDGDPDEDRYFWWPDPGTKEIAAYTNDEMIYMMQRPSTSRVVGLSNLEVLKAVVDAELLGQDFNYRQLSTAAGDGIFDLGENARPDQVEKFSRYWLAEIAGKGATAFWGGTRGAKWIPFRANNQDMQFLEYQEYLVKKTAAVFEMHPQDLGLTAEVNKATAEVLDQQTDERGAKRLLKLVQNHLTREVVWDAGFGGRANNLAFRFTRLNMRESLANAKIEQIQLGEVASESVNAVRRGKGLAPFPEDHFNYPMAQTAVGFVSLRDVPTAREMMESKEAKAPAPGGDEPPPAGKEATTQLVKIEMPEEVGAMVVGAVAEIAKAIASTKQPETPADS